MLLDPRFKQRLLRPEEKNQAINCLKDSITCDYTDNDTNNIDNECELPVTHKDNGMSP